MPERKVVQPHNNDKRYVRRDAKGRFNEVEDAGRASAQDQKKRAKSASKKGYGDRGDRR